MAEGGPLLGWGHSASCTKQRPGCWMFYTHLGDRPSHRDARRTLKETPQLKPFVQWDKGRALYAEPAIPAWDEIETKMAERLALAFVAKSLLDNPAGIARAIREMATETDALLKREGLYGTT